jgi:branched-chain amino acid transport system ATP-binding protein
LRLIWEKKLLNLKKINISYGVIQVVFDLDLNVREGECVALLGSNGSGKTTILNAISGMIPCLSGEISFQDTPCTQNNSTLQYEKGITHVPEGCKIFPHMTVKENLIMGAACRDEAWEKRMETLTWIHKIFPKLNDRQNQLANLLSGGERQLLVVGRGLMALPKLIMIDEPSLGLSPKVLLEIYNTLKILRDEGLTILLSEQNVNQALKIASRGYVLENGRIVMEGSNEDLLGSEHIKKAYLGI